MKTRPFTYWSDGDAWLGYADEFPDYVTQEIPCVRRHGELELA